mmetsp:Transcript_57604/g.117849  ORF Transcript_57604/g.117849 Transcript_57604/m.117849 type:complete len:206 (+) Transcript_57604:361-978(+)
MLPFCFFIASNSFFSASNSSKSTLDSPLAAVNSDSGTIELICFFSLSSSACRSASAAFVLSSSSDSFSFACCDAKRALKLSTFSAAGCRVSAAAVTFESKLVKALFNLPAITRSSYSLSFSSESTSFLKDAAWSGRISIFAMESSSSPTLFIAETCVLTSSTSWFLPFRVIEAVHTVPIRWSPLSADRMASGLLSPSTAVTMSPG